MSEFTVIKTKQVLKIADFVAFVADRETEQVLRRYVMEQAMPHFHIAIGGIDETIAYLAKIERSPLFLMVDLQGSAMPLSDLGRLSQVVEPSVQVVALGERNDVGLFRNLLKLGIRDYLVKPLTVELLSRTINVADGKVGEVMTARVGKVISFTGTRGGVGVTTLAVNLARYLAGDTHRRVAYVDLNVNGGAANTMLGMSSNNGLVDVLQNMHRLDPQYVARSLVAKDGRLSVMSAELGYRDNKPFTPGSLAKVLQILSDSFHYVLLDANDPVSPLAEEAFDHSTRVYMVMDRSVHSTRQAVKLMRHIEDRDNNPQTSLLLNNPNQAVTGKVETSDLVAAIGRSVLYEVKFEPKSLTIAENLGEAPNDNAPHGFKHSIKQIGNDLTGQRAEKTLSMFEKLKLRRK